MTDNQIKQHCVRIMEAAPAAYLTTVDAKRGPQTRAMLNLRNTEQFPGLRFLFRSPYSKFLAYFTTNASSQKLAQIGKNSRAAVYYCLPDQWHGFMIGGPIEAVTDRKLKDRIWRDEWTMYYPKGKGDPDYTVLLLRPRYIKGWLSPVKFEIALGPAQ
jgi:general stress protein 26